MPLFTGFLPEPLFMPRTVGRNTGSFSRSSLRYKIWVEQYIMVFKQCFWQFRQNPGTAGGEMRSLLFTGSVAGRFFVYFCINAEIQAYGKKKCI
jgi:hypothetical protein